MRDTGLGCSGVAGGFGPVNPGRRRSAGGGLMALGRFGSAVMLAMCGLVASVSTSLAAKDTAPTSSGLPVPRYVSLKSDHVNVRGGPTKENDVAWIYTRSGLP